MVYLNLSRTINVAQVKVFRKWIDAAVLIRQCWSVFVLVCASMRSISPSFGTLQMHSRHSRCTNGATATLSYANLFMNMLISSIYLMQHSALQCCNRRSANATMAARTAANVHPQCMRKCAGGARMIYRKISTASRVTND